MGGADYKTSGITRESGTKIRKFETEGGKRAKANRQTNRHVLLSSSTGRLRFKKPSFVSDDYERIYRSNIS
jgi:hypothetical protein